MKTIGIILREFNASYANVELYGLRREIIKMLRQYDVNVICIPIMFENEIDEFNKVKIVIDMCQGIVFPGGLDEWEIDYKLVRYCHEINKPTMGLCLGMQLMGEAFNGETKELGNDKHDRLDKYAHSVRIKKDSKLFQILQKEDIKVNSRHKNNVVKTDLECSAISSDGIIEAIEDSSKSFFIGMQWHPESMIDDENSRKIFDYFLKTC